MVIAIANCFSWCSMGAPHCALLKTHSSWWGGFGLSEESILFGFFLVGFTVLLGDGVASPAPPPVHELGWYAGAPPGSRTAPCTRTVRRPSNKTSSPCTTTRAELNGDDAKDLRAAGGRDVVQTTC
jgi:hypothetical protein